MECCFQINLISKTCMEFKVIIEDFKWNPYKNCYLQPVCGSNVGIGTNNTRENFKQGVMLFSLYGIAKVCWMVPYSTCDMLTLEIIYFQIYVINMGFWCMVYS